MLFRSLVLFTDGISEAMNSADEEWDEPALIAAVHGHEHLRAGEMIPKLMEAADAFVDGAPQSDDMTLIVIRVGGDRVPPRVAEASQGCGKGY